jgi:hypothetical protein
MWYTPDSRFRFLVVRRASDGELVSTHVLDCDRLASAEALELETGKVTVRLFEKFGQGHEIFECAAAGPRPLLGEWWRGRPKLRFLIVRKKQGKLKDMPVRKFMDAAKYRNEEHFDKAVSEEKTRLGGKYPPAEYELMEIEASTLADFKDRYPDLAK